MQPKVIFIDWNGTISYSRFWEQLEDTSHPHHSYFQPLTESLFTKNKPIIADWMLAKFKAEDICKVIADDTKLNYHVIFDELMKSCRTMKFLSGELERLIRGLQSKQMKCVIATDNMDTFDRWTVESMNLRTLFDDILNSYSIGSFKYMVEDNSLPFFNKYLKDNYLNYSDVVLIDDSIDKTGFYQENGFRIINVNKDYTLIDALKSFL